mgnify:CR=1 FL=1
MSNSYLSTLICRQAKKYGDRIALKYRDYETESWISVSWNQFAENGKLGFECFDCIGGRSSGKYRRFFSEYAGMLVYGFWDAFGSRIVTIPLYATSSEAQVHYILQDAGIRFLFVGEQYQYDVACRVQNLCKTLKQIIIFDPKVKRSASDTNSIYYSDFLKLGMERKFQAEVDKRTSESGNGDLVNILYTSGTTGESKGVMLHHSCYEAAFAAHDGRLTTLGESDVVMNFLPFTHIFRTCLELLLYK